MILAVALLIVHMVQFFTPVHVNYTPRSGGAEMKSCMRWELIQFCVGLAWHGRL